jgi:hypothetical protein
MASTYRIVDEPRRGPLDRFVTNPIWPFFGLMLGGAILGVPWFVFNGIALGSATLRKEIAWAAACLPVTAGLLFGLLALYQRELLPERALPYLGMALLAWKMLVGYGVFNLQRRSFALWEHYGGQPRRAFVILALAFVLRTQVLSGLGVWRLVLE